VAAPRKPRPRPPTSGALTAPIRPASANAFTPRSGNAPSRATAAPSGPAIAVQIFSSAAVKPAGSGDMRTSPTTPRPHARLYGGNLSRGSTPAGRKNNQRRERGFIRSIVLGAGIGQAWGRLRAGLGQALARPGKGSDPGSGSRPLALRRRAAGARDHHFGRFDNRQGVIPASQLQRAHGVSRNDGGQRLIPDAQANLCEQDTDAHLHDEHVGS